MTLALLSDVGGTNIRFALCRDDGPLQALAEIVADDCPSFEDAAQHYLGETEVDLVAVAVAGPVTNGCAVMTNRDWIIEESSIADALGVEWVRLLNDFEAQALALPCLGDQDLSPVGKAFRPEARAPKVVLGPGTGFGAAALLPAPGGGWLPVCGEAGHMTLAAANEAEAVLLAGLRQEFGHVSVERIVSGGGLVLLYSVLSGERKAVSDPAEVTARATAGDPLAIAVMGHFTRFLAAAAADLALVFAAKGGVYLSGGILPRLGVHLDPAAYLDRFTDKGRFRDYLSAIPSAVVTHPAPALAGLAAVAFR
ncbi:MAG: ROK family protein [Alphaproteobacteria bacterium]|nr:ROK family protein [Alphaproteobacteria bacterium]